MVSKRQYIVLNSCADDWELFYFPFAWINYGGQVFRRTSLHEMGGRRLGLNIHIPPSRYEDKGPSTVSVAGLEVAWDIRILITLGLLSAQRGRADEKREPVGPAGLAKAQLSISRCSHALDFDPHVGRCGEGPT